MEDRPIVEALSIDRYDTLTTREREVFQLRKLGLRTQIALVPYP